MHARAHTVEVAIDAELQQIRRRVAGPPGLLWLNHGKSRRRKVEPINEGVDKTYRVVWADIVVKRLRQ
jgi:hypothetical protein